MATPTQLSLYNQALTRHLGERALLSLAEPQEARYALDENYSAVLDECLEQGYWKHARRKIALTGSLTPPDPPPPAAPDFLPGDFVSGDFIASAVPTPTTLPTLPSVYWFVVPPDCLQFYMLSTVDTYDVPLNDYAFEKGMIQARFDTIYLTYVSNHEEYGLDYPNWSPLFSRYVGAALADAICLRITQSEPLSDKLEKRVKKYKMMALSRDAMEGPTQRLPPGTWVTSRYRGGQDTRDRQVY